MIWGIINLLLGFVYWLVLEKLAINHISLFWEAWFKFLLCFYIYAQVWDGEMTLKHVWNPKLSSTRSKINLKGNILYLIGGWPKLYLFGCSVSSAGRKCTPMIRHVSLPLRLNQQTGWSSVHFQLSNRHKLNKSMKATEEIGNWIFFHFYIFCYYFPTWGRETHWKITHFDLKLFFKCYIPWFGSSEINDWSWDHSN